MAKQDTTANPVVENSSSLWSKIGKQASNVGAATTAVYEAGKNVKNAAKDAKPAIAATAEIPPGTVGGGGDEQYDPEIVNRWKSWADTGGFSDDDIGNIRARNVAPIRAAYGLAQSNVDRQRALQGGYSPNYTAASAKMAREQSSAMSDASRNAEGDIAEMRNRAKLQGLEGLTQVTPKIGGGPAAPAAAPEPVVAAPKKKKSIWGKIGGALGKVGKYAGTAATIAGMFSDENMKENIKPVKKGSVLKKMKNLPMSTYNYKGDSESHMGPMAQDFNRIFPNEGGNRVIPYRKLAEIGMAINKELAERIS